MPSAEASSVLLRTKLYRPPLPRDYLERTRLHPERLTSVPVTLVSAAAGYGKSVLVSRWLELWDGPAAWLSLDEADSDLRQFLEYLCAAVESMFPAALTDFHNLLAPTLPSASILARTLINDLDDIDEPFVLVLDDVHRIHGRAVLDMLTEIMNHPPRPLHLILVGRQDPFLPIVRLRARGQLREVRSADLSFTPAEAQAFLEYRAGEVDQHLSEAWQDRAEGWATGLRLAALALRTGVAVPEEPAVGSKLARDVMSFLVSEALQQQPPAIRRHLLRTSLVAQFSASLSDALQAGDGHGDAVREDVSGESFVEWLKEAELFLIPLDLEHGWFRYHHLFQDTLREEARRILGTEAVVALHGRAAAWFEEEGLVTEALGQALAAADVERACDIVARHRAAEFTQDRWYVVHRWLERIPPEVRWERPELLLAEANVEYVRFRMDRIPALVEQAASLVDERAADPILLGEIGFFRGMLQFWDGQPQAAEKTLESALELLDHGPPYLESETELHLGVTRCMAGKKDRAIADLEERIRTRTTPGRGDPLRRGGLTLVQLASGDLRRAKEEAEIFWRVAAEREVVNLTAWSSYLRGCVDLHALELESAARHLGRVVEQRFILDTRAAVDAFAALVLVHQLAGHPQGAWDTGARLEDFVRERPEFLSLERSIQARMSVLRGDAAAALDWARSLDGDPEPASLFTWTDVPAITRIRVLTAAGTEADRETAISELETYSAACEEWNFVGHSIDIAALQALALSKRGRISEATESLERAVGLARTGGWIRPFLEAGSEMRLLLSRLRPRDGDREFVRRLDDAFERWGAPVAEPSTQAAPQPMDRRPAPSPAADLTSRELDVLELLAERLQDKEIASRLYITTHTVNHHLKRIYRKLGVSGRREACRRATELGIIGGQPKA